MTEDGIPLSAETSSDMRLVIVIVQDVDASSLSDSLTSEKFGVTRINTAGGFLREGNASFLIGVEEKRLGALMGIIRRCCVTRTQYVNPLPPIMEPGEFLMPYPVEVQVGGAIVFVLNVDRYEKL